MDKGQVEALSRGIRRSLSYLNRLRTRMERAPFSPDDPLFQLVSTAYEAVHHVSVHVHYLACDADTRRVKRPER